MIVPCDSFCDGFYVFWHWCLFGKNVRICARRFNDEHCNRTLNRQIRGEPGAESQNPIRRFVQRLKDCGIQHYYIDDVQLELREQNKFHKNLIRRFTIYVAVIYVLQI